MWQDLDYILLYSFIIAEKSFFESMDPEDLAQWLLQEFGNSYEVDVAKLESEFGSLS